MLVTRPRYWILRDRTAVPVARVTDWAEWFQTAERHVALDVVRFPRALSSMVQSSGVRVSTVFIGLDHSFGHGPPLLFETMIFGGFHNDYCRRCTTWEQAETMHRDALQLVRRLRFVPLWLQTIAARSPRLYYRMRYYVRWFVEIFTKEKPE